MSRWLMYVALTFLVLSVTYLPFFYSTASASRSNSVQLSLTPSVNSTSIGIPVAFNGTISGGNFTYVVYTVVGPDGNAHNASVSLTGSAFSFSYVFDSVGNWTVFCTAGDPSNPLAVSDPLLLSVDAGAPSTFMGVPFVWLGVAILVVSAVSLVYLVYAIRRRTEEESKAAGGRPATRRTPSGGAPTTVRAAKAD